MSHDRPQVPPCQCEQPGHCARYDQDMGVHMWSVCRGRNVPEMLANAYRWLWDLVGGPAAQKIHHERKMPCAHLGQLIDQSAGPCPGCWAYKCHGGHNSCTLTKPEPGHHLCLACNDYVPADDLQIPFQDIGPRLTNLTQSDSVKVDRTIVVQDIGKGADGSPS
jgi:hypothetical protein